MTIQDIKNRGIVGAGGAGFPTYIKLNAHPDTLIMNAAECEPLLHKDIEILRHHLEEVLEGFRLAMQITGARQGIIGIKEKHGDVIARLESTISKNIRLQTIGDFYPAGDEVLLVYLTTRRIIQPGQLPVSVGCVVQNVETLLNIARAHPVVEKYISVAGAIESPATIRVPIGISFADILRQFKINVKNYVLRTGGLMMGELVTDLNQTVTKRTGALIVLPPDHHCITMYQRYSTPQMTDRTAKSSCDQCSYCTEFCPRYLIGHPVRPETAMRNRMFTRQEISLLDPGSAFCCECNLCTMFACPESLDPKGATVIEKRILQQQGAKWEGLPVSPHPMMDFRKVPTKKLMQRLDVIMYKDEGPLQEFVFQPENLTVNLQQHAGKAARPAVEKGDRVEKYQIIADAPVEVSAPVHSPVSGTISEVNENNIVIQRQ
jgi:Na+-translocating ferredoxin:NAD+ oxidoreductase RnfC subunit